MINPNIHFMIERYTKSKIKLLSFVLLLQFISLDALIALDLNGQNIKSVREVFVSIQLEEAALMEVFNYLESISGYRFSYENSDIENKLEKLDLIHENISVADILVILSREYGLAFRQYNNNILVDRAKTVFKKPSIEVVIADIEVSGKITDEEGLGLPGASVIIKGTTVGTVTDADGNYKLVVPEGAVLKISYIGYASQEVAVSGRSVINAQLVLDIEQLDEIIVVGYGEKTTETLSGSVYTIDSKQFESRPQTNALQSLQGAIPGLVITRSGGGRVGREQNNVLIRGITSRSAPGVLVVIDGIVQAEQDADALYQLNPQDIESVTVLKDAQAAIYGARAAGGVILVTTKKGSGGKPTFKYSGNLSINRLADRHPTFANLEDFARFNDAAFEAAGSPFRPYQYLIPQFDDGTIRVGDGQTIAGPFSDVPLMSTNYVDWLDELYGGSRYMQTHNLSVSGSSERSNYFVSAGIIDQPGSLRERWGNNSNQRYFARMKYAFDVRDNLTLSTNISFERQKIIEPSGYGFGQQLANGVWSNHLPLTPGGNPLNYGGFQSPIAHLRDGGDGEEISYRQNVQFGAEFRPLEGLKIKGDFSVNVDNGSLLGITKIVTQYNLDDTPSFNNPFRSVARNSFDRDVHRVANLYATYDFSVLRDLEVSVTAGAAHEEWDRESGITTGFDLVSELLPNTGFADAETIQDFYFGTHWAVSSLFGRMSYVYKGKYILEGNYRRDATSRFAPDFRVGNFYGGSAAWNISEEAFMSGLSGIFDLLKLRVSIGELGNQVQVNNDSDPGLNFRFKSFLNIFTPTQGFAFGNPDNPAIAQLAAFDGRDLAAPERKWETTTVKNIGLNFEILDSRLTGQVDYFIKTTRDVLVSLDFPDVLGANPPLTNGGKIETRGWELALSWQDKIGDDFSYSVSVAVSDDWNEILSLEDARIVGRGRNPFNEGYSAESWFGPVFDGFIQDQQELDEYLERFGGGGALPSNLASIGIGAAKFKDLDGDGVFEPDVLYNPGDPGSGDMALIGDTRLRMPYSVNMSARWKNFDIGLFLQGVGRQPLPNPVRPPGSSWWENPYQHFIGQTWTETNRGALHPRHITDNAVFGYNYGASDAPYYWVKAHYLRLKNLQVGYTLPTEVLSKAGIGNVRVYFSGNDLLEFTPIRGDFDPESYTRNTTPIFRSYSLGIDLTF